MSAPFPDKDFLAGHWVSLRELARNTCKGSSEDFSCSIPDLRALDFDKIKNDICAYRGFRLSSVDAVTIVEDGRIFFIEFKDKIPNPMAQLRKKAFDSLFLFWIAAGKRLTMEEIRDRAVFCYVSTKEQDRHDDDLLRELEGSGNENLGQVLPAQLAELHNSGHYGDVVSWSPTEFAENILNFGVAPSIVDLMTRIDIEYHPQPNRPPVNTAIPSNDFKASVSPIAKMRVVDRDDPFTPPIQQKVQEGNGDKEERKRHPYNCLFGAETYNAENATAAFTYNWGKKKKQRAMPLAARCFDTFMLWSLAYHFKERLEDIGGILCGRVTYTGTGPDCIPEPEGSTSDFDCFRAIFHTPYSEGRPLAPFVEQNLYAQLQ